MPTAVMKKILKRVRARSRRPKLGTLFVLLAKTVVISSAGLAGIGEHEKARI